MRYIFIFVFLVNSALAQRAVEISSVGGLGENNGFIICSGQLPMQLVNIRDDSNSSTRRVKLKGVVVNYQSKQPLNDFRIYVAKKNEELNFIVIVDTVYDAGKDRKNRLTKSNRNEGSFAVNRRLNNDEMLYIDQTGYSMIEIKFAQAGLKP